MPDFQDFIAEIDKAGIIIEGRDQFIKKAETAQDWLDAVTSMALTGRYDSIRLVRTAEDSPSDEEIGRILRGYPFHPGQRDLIIQNVIIVA